MIPTVDDSESQVAFPASNDRRDFQALSADNSDNKKATPLKSRMSTLNLITLSISMAGAQIAWTVELGYGNPFLLSLGLPEQLTSLVWLAGPISGLIAQPLIGAISDSSTSKYRRRFWVISSTGVLVLSTLVLAYCVDIAHFLVDIFGVGYGDWDEERKRLAKNTAIGIAIAMFYFLDFALNALQASLRNLLLDVTPPAQLNAGNAWHGRMTHAGNIVGYGFGFLPLASLPIIRLISGDQFRKFCIICIVILVITIAITCYCHEEQEGAKPLSNRNSGAQQLRDMVQNIYKAATNLPKPIRRVCIVQLFAFMGWFPFLFYATTYVGQVMAKEHNKEPDAELATRKGEFALLLYSIVAVGAGTLLPHLANRDRRLMAHKGDENEDAELARIKQMVHTWKVEAAQKGQPLRLPVMPFLLRNIWTGALLLFSLLMISTLFVNTVTQATFVISLVGICWAVACWVPFAIIMELLKEAPAKPIRRPTHVRATSIPVHLDRYGRAQGSTERQPLLRRRSYDEMDANADDEAPEVVKMAGGTVLGIHNLAIVLPQFIVSLVASAIFKAVDGTNSPDGAESTYLGKNGVAWILRFGGVCTLFGALIARMVPPTPTEKAMRRRLAEMRILRDAASTPP